MRLSSSASSGATCKEEEDAGVCAYERHPGGAPPREQGTRALGTKNNIISSHQPLDVGRPGVVLDVGQVGGQRPVVDGVDDGDGQSLLPAAEVLQQQPFEGADLPQTRLKGAEVPH